MTRHEFDQRGLALLREVEAKVRELMAIALETGVPASTAVHLIARVFMWSQCEMVRQNIEAGMAYTEISRQVGEMGPLAVKLYECMMDPVHPDEGLHLFDGFITTRDETVRRQ